MEKLIIAGPCGAESKRQLIDTCVALAATGRVHMLRAGVWKPRTHPGSWEGVGSRGLAWLAEARQLAGLPVAVEVASARHVESALRHGIDALWIGARTTVSPFAVQEIAEAAAAMVVAQEKNPHSTLHCGRRSDHQIACGAPPADGIPHLLIKNPVNPDVELWSGAVERFLNAGFAPEQIALVHRGFSCGGRDAYRNAPMWHLVFEMRTRHPELRMLCDPSHIGGARQFVPEIAQTAADLCYDGLMIESHITPECALSDAAQQLTPAALDELLGRLKWRSSCAGDPEFIRALERLRGEIDQIDTEIFELLGRRMAISEQIGRQKRDNDVTILQGDRWRDIVTRITARAEVLGLSPEFIKTILNAIHTESIARQV